MTKPHQPHNPATARAPWLDNPTRGDVAADHPVWHRSETDVFAGRPDRREK
jgi:hypothetical protein